MTEEEKRFFVELIGGVNDKVDTLSQDVSSMKQDVASMKQDITSMQQDIAELKQDMVSVKQDMVSMKDDLEKKIQISHDSLLNAILGVQKELRQEERKTNQRFQKMDSLHKSISQAYKEYEEDKALA